MTNGDERQATSPRRSATTPAPTPDTVFGRGVPRLARGIVWSDLVREMEEEHAERMAAAAGAVVALPERRHDGPDHREEAA